MESTHAIGEDTKMLEMIRDISDQLQEMKKTAEETYRVVIETAHKSEIREVKSKGRDEALSQAIASIEEDNQDHKATDTERFNAVNDRFNSLGLPMSTWLKLVGLSVAASGVIVTLVLAFND